MEDIKKELKQLYARGRDKELIKRLNKLAPKQSEDIENELYGWIGRYEDMTKKARRGRLSVADETLLRAQLGDDLLGLIDELGQGNGSQVKILFLAANPENTGRLRLGKELAEIEDSIKLSQHRERFDLQQRFAVKIEDLSIQMVSIMPRIVHFSGHGVELDSPSDAPGSRSLDFSEIAPEQQLTGGIALEDEQGNAQVVPADKLANLFRHFEGKIDCVFLNACHSQLQANAILPYVPYIIGMNTAVPDATAIEFAKQFYGTLGAKAELDIPFAFDIAKTFLANKELPGANIPELIRQA